MRHLRGAVAAVAFAEQVFGRSAAAVLSDIERDDLGHSLRVLSHAVEGFAAVGLGWPAPAGADRIDEYEIGEGEPGRGVVLHARRGRVVAGKLENARAEDTQVQIRRCRARSAVEGEGDGTVRRFGIFRD